MKIIISHDVDHLYVQDHLLHDLIIPKLWIRSFFQLVKREISVKVFLNRIAYVFSKRQHRIPEVLEFDKENNIPSVFFFGMANGLGMSYKREKAIPYIQYVREKKFDVGVHGIDYTTFKKMEEEFNAFRELSKLKEFGIRMHYVRFNAQTFEKLSNCGYLFDSTEFNKKNIEIKPPYKIGDMWEFPLHIMDGYVIKLGDMEESKKNTLSIIKEARDKKVPYCTILFHDYLYNEKCYPQEKEWYQWLIRYLKKEGYEFISYRQAILELKGILE